MSVLVLINTDKERTQEAWDTLRFYLKHNNVEYHLYSDEWYEEREKTLAGITHVIALGGDGTILRAAHLIGSTQIPLLGVKFGRLGFLAGCSPEDMVPAVADLLNEKIPIEPRATLSASVVGSQGSVEQADLFALNEVAIARGASGRIITSEIRINDVEIARMRGDGVIVATATGSTGYALSAGGPLVASGFTGRVVVPIAPHTLMSRAIMTDPADEVTIRVVDSRRGEGDLFIDGERLEVAQLDTVRICRGKDDLLLARYCGEDTTVNGFYPAVSQVFFGGSDA